MNAFIHFYIRTDRPAKDGSVPVCLLLQMSKNQRVRICTDKLIPLKNKYRKLNTEQLKSLEKTKEELYCWDNIREKATKDAENWERVNLYIDKEKAKINEILLKFDMLNRTLTAQSFKKAYLKPAATDSFYQYFKDELDKRKHLISKGTYTTYLVTLNKVNNFKPNLTLADIDYKFLIQFENHMLKPTKEDGLGNQQITVSKNMRTIRTFMGLAIKNDDFPKEDYPFKDYKIKYIDPMLTSRDYLEPDDVLKLEQLLSPEKISSLTPGEIRATQRFLFACYTGLRFSDVNALRWKEHVFSKYIFNPSTKKMVFRSYIEITMTKTSLPVFIPLIDKAAEIMGERNEESTVFTHISNQKVNAHLKEINKKAELNKKLSFHVARHSFATICFLYGIPLEVGQKLLGHKNRKFTEIYTHLSKNKLFYEMDKLNRGLSEYALISEEADAQKQNLKEMLPMLQDLSPEKLEQLKGLIKMLK
jgi:site-specific recombinase XerD